VLPLWSLTQSVELIQESRRAQEAMSAGRFEEAISILSELVKAVPNNPVLIMSLGIAQHMTGRHRDAIQQFEGALRLDPKLVQVWHYIGASYLKLDEPARAVEPLQKAIESQPDDKKSRLMLAYALASLERYEQASMHFREIAQLHPQNPRAWYWLGRCYESLSRRAFEELEKVAQDSAYVHSLVARALAKQERYSSAFHLYRRALDKSPGMRGVHAALAEIYEKTEHPDWAAVEEEKERKIPPPDCGSQKFECDFLAGRYHEIVAATKGKVSPESNYWLSRAYEELAFEAFSRLTQLPASAELHQLKAEVHSSQGRHQEAAKEWREALKLEPDNPIVQWELAAALYSSRDYSAALPLLDKLLEREPKSARLNFVKGDVFFNLQKPEQAIPFLKTALRYDSVLTSAHWALGQAYAQVGQAEQAIPHLKLALALDKDGSIHYQLAQAYKVTGRRKLAQEALKKYQEIQKSVHAEQKQTDEESEITPP
jgi:tetratricopeptide (TPR) repeat protein